jgi:formate-dependent nitrite reductase cytochrome c552 subunit
VSKITKAAEGKPCTARISNVCNGDHTKTAWAHLNSIRWGAGRGRKAPDVCGLIACSDCHDAIDGRVKKNKLGQKLDPEFVKLCALEGHMESLMILWEEGII